jgi:tetratricopeptide (TPR) repeat protein
MDLLGSTHLVNGQPLQAIPYLEKALAAHTRRGGNPGYDVKPLLNTLAAAYLMCGQRDMAMPLFQQMNDGSPMRKDADTAALLILLGQRLSFFGSGGKGIILLEHVLDLQRAKYGADHREVWPAMSAVADAYYRRGDLEKSNTLFEQVLQSARASSPVAHAIVAQMMRERGLLHLHAGRTAEAIRQFEGVLQKNLVGRPTEYDRLNLAMAYVAGGQPEKAIALAESALAGFTAREGPQGANHFAAASCLADAYFRCGRLSEAEPLLVRWLDRMRPRPGNKVLLTASLTKLAACRWAAHRAAEAEALLRETRRNYIEWAGRSSVDLQKSIDVVYHDAESLLGVVLAGRREDAEAESLLVDSARALVDEAPFLLPADRHLPEAALTRVIDFYQARDNQKQAARWRAERKAFRESRGKSDTGPP